MGSILAVAAGAYMLVLGLMFGFQRQLLYLPSREAPDLAESGVDRLMEPVRVTTADGLEILLWYCPPSTPNAPVLALFHGNGGHIGHRAPKMKPYIEAGYGVLLAGYRGYGGNPGRPTEEGLYSDARAALDFFARQGLGAERLVLYGESLGSAVAVQMATERSVAALILEAPMTSVAAVAQARYPIFPVRWLVLDRFDSLAKIGSVRAPLLLMHGERDTVVPIRFGRVLFEAANEPKEARYFTDAGHNDLQAFGAPDAVLDFLERLNR
ncbi:alpha/beta hydrolase [Rhodospirillaceae bacterium SYSU D60014]|uniref:alpha/beta hydrolase n=1 Tax=Virgifigura deserti TaxID=2268457 RepID=UPI000E676092